MKVRLSARAEADIESIGDWIATDSPRRALSFTRQIREKCAGIGRAPNMFAIAPGFESWGVRRRVFGNYLIFYLVTDAQVQILRVVHAAQDQTEIAFD